MQGRHPEPAEGASPPVPDPLRRVAVLAWVGDRVSLVARRTASGWVDVVRVARDDLPDEPAYLARIAHEIGDAARVLIMGPDGLRTQLERESVAIYHHPDRLVDVEPAGEATPEALAARLRDLPV